VKQEALESKQFRVIRMKYMQIQQNCEKKQGYTVHIPGQKYLTANGFWSTMTITHLQN